MTAPAKHSNAVGGGEHAAHPPFDLAVSGWEILDRLNIPVLAVNRDHSIAYANQAARAAFSVELEQMDRTFCYSVLLGRDQPCGPGGCDCALHNIWNSSQPASAIHEVRQPDGSIKLQAITTVALAGNGGGQAVVTFQDVTRHLLLEHCLHQVLTGVGNATGMKYFRLLTEKLSQALGIESVLAGRYLRARHRISSLAYYTEGSHSTSFSYPLEGTPCEQTVGGRLVCIERDAYKLYPQDEYFAQAKIESYVGLPLIGAKGETLGVLSAISARPLDIPDVAKTLLSAFATRASAELERMDAELALRQAHASLEQEIARRTAALRESQERYQLLFNGGSDAVVVFRLERLPGGEVAPGRFIAVNDVAVKRYGYTREELLELTPQALNTPKGMAGLSPRLTEMLHRKRVLYEAEHVARNGRRIPVEINAQLLDLDGKPVALATVRDISERLAAEAALRESEKRFRSIIEKTPVGMCISDDRGIYEYVNTSFCEIFGYEPAELLGRPLTMLAGAARQRELLEAAHHNVIHGQGEFRGELDTQHKDGRPLVILIDAIRLLGADGRMKKVAFVMDVTASKLHQDQVRQFALLAELSPEPIIRFDRQGRVLLANPASHEVFQQEECQNQGLPCLIPELAGFDFAGCIDQAGLYDMTCSRDGQSYRLTIRGVPDLQFGQLYATDITATVKARQHAEDASLAKSQFLANMSHELRTPLSAINGFSEVLLEQAFGPLNQQQQEYLRRINQSGQHLLSLINDLLDLAKIEAGKLELMWEELDLRLVCHEACDLISGRIQHRELELARELPSSPAPYRGDSLRLRQVLINLLSNAVKFTRQGTVTVKLERGEQHYRLSVRDTGIGIEPEKMSRLFRRFEQLHDPRLVGDVGSGLGLWLCREIVAAHGGGISAESTPGMGSVFTVALPINRATL